LAWLVFYQAFKMKRIVIIITLFCFAQNIFGQDQKYIDSLLLKMNEPISDTARINLLNKIAADIVYINSEKIYDYSMQALELSEEEKYKKGIAESYNNLGIFFRTKGVYDLAIDYFYSSLEIMEEINDLDGIARCYNLIGIIYYFLNNYDLSLQYYNKALEINIKQNDKKWISGNSNNLGMIYEKMDDYSKALQFYLKSLETNIELNNQNWIANNYANIGSLYQKMGNPKCLEYFVKQLEIKEAQGDADGISSSNRLIGNYYNSQAEYDQAFPYLQRSYHIADSIGSLYTAKDAAESLSNSYAGVSSYKEAFHFHEIFKRLNDSLKLAENSQKITRLEMQYQFRKDQQLKDLEYQKTELFQISIAIVLVLLVVIILMLFGRQRARVNRQNLFQEKLEIENRSLQEELGYKDKQLQDNVNYLVTKNDLITTISEKLIEIKPAIKKENQKTINEVILELQSSVDTDIWKEFELRFNQVHSDFYKALNLKYPNLSANDKKLSAFLRLNMSTKDIGSITGQSISSIETARTRLRKKLKISNSDINLSDFLSEV